MKKAIVTLAIGQHSLKSWTQVCRKGWTAYCERHGYDLVAIEQPLDTSERASNRSPAWQKCLVLGQSWAADYDYIVWVDADILINPIAPSIVEGCPKEKIGVIDELAYPTVADHQALVRGGMKVLGDAEFYHTRVGLPGGQKHIVQTGVMVMSPRHHRDLLEHVYYSYEDHPNLFYEMMFLSHEMQKHGLQHWIDPRFNAVLYLLIFRSILRNGGREPTEPELRHFTLEQYRRNYFLHFAGRRYKYLFPLIEFSGA